MDLYAEKQAAEQKASKRRQFEEAFADIASVERRPKKKLEEFLAEESAPREWSDARRAIEALFAPDS